MGCVAGVVFIAVVAVFDVAIAVVVLTVLELLGARVGIGVLVVAVLPTMGVVVEPVPVLFVVGRPVPRVPDPLNRACEADIFCP